MLSYCLLNSCLALAVMSGTSGLRDILKFILQLLLTVLLLTDQMGMFAAHQRFTPWTKYMDSGSYAEVLLI